MDDKDLQIAALQNMLNQKEQVIFQLTKEIIKLTPKTVEKVN